MNGSTDYNSRNDNKRLNDGLEDFFTEAKRRRYAPSDRGNSQAYDDEMAARLSDLAPVYLQSSHQQHQQQPVHSPHPLSDNTYTNPSQLQIPPIHSSSDLANINTFLVQLGKEITSDGYTPQHEVVTRGGDPGGFSDQELAALGLAGMPGIGVNYNDASHSNDSSSGGYPIHSQYAMPSPAHQSAQRYQPQHHPQQQMHQSLSPTAPPYHSPQPPQGSYAFSPSPYPHSVPQLASSDSRGLSSVRKQQYTRLKEAPLSPTSSAMDVESPRSSRAGSPELPGGRWRSGDPSLKLPAIPSNASSEPSTRPSTSSGGSVRGAGRGMSLPPLAALSINESGGPPGRLYPRLPPISSILAPSSPSPSSSGTASPVWTHSRVSSARRTPAERAAHAKIVKELLVRVNREWMRVHGRPGDVDMS